MKPQKKNLRPFSSGFKIKKTQLMSRETRQQINIQEEQDIQQQYSQHQIQQDDEINKNEIHQKLRRLYAEGVKRMKNYQIQEALNLFRTFVQKLASDVGRETEYFTRDFNELIKTVCNYAMKVSQESGNHELSIMILLWAEDLTNPVHSFEAIPVQRCIVYNDLGCVYRRSGKLQIALNSLERALEIISDHETIGKTITYLNLTAVLSQMGRHDKALSYAYESFDASQKELKQFLRNAEQQDDDNQYREKLKYIGIAMHNIGVEEDCCGQLETAIQWYFKAVEYIEKHLGEDDPLMMKFNSSLQKAKEKQELLLKDSKSKLKQQFLNKSGLPKAVTSINLLKTGNATSNEKKTFYFRGPSRLSQSSVNLLKNESLQPQKQESQEVKQAVQQKFQVRFKESQESASENEGKNGKQSELNELRTIGILEWSDDDSEKMGNKYDEKGDNDNSLQQALELDIKGVQSQNIQQQQEHVMTEQELRDQRISFLNKMTLYEIERPRTYEPQPQHEENQEAMDDIQKDFEIDQLKIIRIQSYIRMKLHQKRYRKELEVIRKQKKQESYDNNIKRIQKWMRNMLFKFRTKRVRINI